MNAGEVQSRGWETELVGSMAAGVAIQASYTRMDTEYLTAPPALVGQRFNALTPKHLWKLWAIRRPQENAVTGWTLGLGLQGQSETEFLPPRGQGGFTLTNALLGYQFENFSVNLNANNIFDKVYYTRFGGVNIYNTYGPPRNYSLTVRASY